MAQGALAAPAAARDGEAGDDGERALRPPPTRRAPTVPVEALAKKFSPHAGAEDVSEAITAVAAIAGARAPAPVLPRSSPRALARSRARALACAQRAARGAYTPAGRSQTRAAARGGPACALRTADARRQRPMATARCTQRSSLPCGASASWATCMTCTTGRRTRGARGRSGCSRRRWASCERPPSGRPCAAPARQPARTCCRRSTRPSARATNGSP